MVQSFNKQEATVSIKLLLKKKEGFKFLPFPVLSDIPVNIYYSGGFFMKPEYKSGDIVWVNFATHSIQNAMLGQSDETSESAFNIHDAFVVGAYKTKKNIKPKLLQLLGKDGIVLGHEDGDSYINIKKDEIIFQVGGDSGHKMTMTDDKLESNKDIETEKDVIVESKIRRISGIKHGHVTSAGSSISKIPIGEA
ncbi:hypothetical protein EHQ43_08820 [Leptospira bouyouniensis]|uniref:Phage protein Gp138 N-terminal domain-containing protein n=1 Tax=Leptospira bouyouniensis TaxID=2484911 RepID=A0A7I0HRZ4_9LEPT|nr:Gp138 family membrane-puncturing spike protein [Leptospira bouyouniensis]TGL06503.1 hypothetical protein EHQ43_08820 [Leptospira bouyouniensis]